MKEDSLDRAYEAGTSWLALVDSGEYDRSWDEAAAHFKSLVPQDEWLRKVDGVRTPLGTTQHRSEVSRQYTQALPGAPDGEYVVFKFTTSFRQKQSSTETLTLTHEPDGTRRVSGYFIH